MVKSNFADEGQDDQSSLSCCYSFQRDHYLAEETKFLYVECYALVGKGINHTDLYADSNYKFKIMSETKYVKSKVFMT